MKKIFKLPVVIIVSIIWIISTYFLCTPITKYYIKIHELAKIESIPGLGFMIGYLEYVIILPVIIYWTLSIIVFIFNKIKENHLQK